MRTNSFGMECAPIFQSYRAAFPTLHVQEGSSAVKGHTSTRLPFDFTPSTLASQNVLYYTSYNYTCSVSLWCSKCSSPKPHL